VVEALTYYGHREKLRLVGKEDALEQLNLAALRIAKEVADETGTLFAGNICNCTYYSTLFYSLPTSPPPTSFYSADSHTLVLSSSSSSAANLWEGKDQSAEVTESVREMFAEQIKWAKQAGVDFVIAETFGFLGEALLANRVIKEQFDLPSVVTIVIHQDGKTRDGYSAVEALLALEVRPSSPARSCPPPYLTD
jgi:betaine-homocysteine S-methyltransferase